jgi:hypothetical protein
MSTPNFKENLEQLAETSAWSRMRLYGDDGEIAAVIENAPGSAGSFRVYYHLAVKWGGLGPKAAAEGLVLFAEHAEDARANPGKHPNIDRLLGCLASNCYYSVRCEPRS